MKEKISKIIKFILELAFMVLIVIIILENFGITSCSYTPSSDPYANHANQEIERY